MEKEQQDIFVLLCSSCGRKDFCYWRKNLEVIAGQFKPFDLKYIMVDFEKGHHKALKKGLPWSISGCQQPNPALNIVVIEY